MKNFKSERRLVTDICRRMWQQGFAAANDGNVSIKVGKNLILTTPSGISKSLVTPKKLILTDMDGNVVQGAEGLHPSSEIRMHLRCYKDRDDICAVVHAHPPAATAFAAAHMPLDEYLTAGMVLGLGAVPVAPYATPSTDGVPESIAALIQNHDAILLANHGALTVGADLFAAYYHMETLEQTAKITMYTKIIGGGSELGQEQCVELINLRKTKYSLSGRHPGYVKFDDKDKSARTRRRRN